MVLNDTLANALSLILNNEIIGKYECMIKPSSYVISEVLRVMRDSGYVNEIKKIEDNRGGYLKVLLAGTINKCGVIKPRYSAKISDIEKFERRYLPAKDFGILVLSTPSGILTHYEAKKKKVGGKLLAYCY